MEFEDSIHDASPVPVSPTPLPGTDTLPEELESFDKIFLFASGPPNSDRALEAPWRNNVHLCLYS